MDFVSTLRGLLEDVWITLFPSFDVPYVRVRKENTKLEKRTKDPRPKKPSLFTHNVQIKGTARFNQAQTSPRTHAVTRSHAAVHLETRFDLVRWVRGCFVSENPHRQEFLFYREFLQTFFTFCVVIYKAPWLQEPKDISRLCRLVCVSKILQRTLMTVLPNNISPLKDSNHLKGVR